jgi:hypothetical protein
VGAKHHRVGGQYVVRRLDVEGVGLEAGGVCDAVVERVEVVVGGLDLGPLGDTVAQAHEEVHYLIYDAHRRVQAPLRVRHAGKCYVHGLRPEPLLALGSDDRREALIEGGFDLLGGPVRGTTDLAALLGRQIPDALLYLGEPGRAAQVLYTDGLEIGRGSRRRDGGEGLLTKLLYTLDRHHKKRYGSIRIYAS